MKMIRFLYWGVWLLLSFWLLWWITEGLTATDQTASSVPFMDGIASPAAPVLIGTAWGCMLTFGPLEMSTTKIRLKKSRATELAMGRVIQAEHTGLTVNDVPQYDIYMRVMPRGGGEFIGRVRTLVRSRDASLTQEGFAHPVRYVPDHHDDLLFADQDDPSVRTAMIDWRVQRGLMEPHRARAILHGVSAPASVLEIKPTGARLDGEVQAKLRLVVAPINQAPWEADITGYFAPELLPAIQVGSPVTAWYLPTDVNTIGLEMKVSS